jgi:translation initiation factor IF-3
MDNGEERGVLDTREARVLATGLGLDLVEIDDETIPPTCRVMDYGAHRRATRPRRVQVAEVISRIQVGEDEIGRHVARIGRHLADGIPVRFTVVFRGRELDSTVAANQLVDRIATGVADHGSLSGTPGLKGRRYRALFTPAMAVTT